MNNAVWVKAALAVSAMIVLSELESKVGTGAGVVPRVGTQASITAVIKRSVITLLLRRVMFPLNIRYYLTMIAT